MRFKILFLISIYLPLYLLSCGGDTKFDPPLSEYPGLNTIRISSDEYLFSYIDRYKNIKAVSLVGNFKVNGKRKSMIKMHDLNNDGIYRCSLTPDKGVYFYKYLINNSLLVSPQPKNNTRRSVDGAAELKVTKSSSLYFSKVFPCDETSVTNLTNISCVIKGKYEQLDPKTISIKLNYKNIKVKYDAQKGVITGIVKNPKEGQYFLQISARNKNQKNIPEFRSTFYYYKNRIKNTKHSALEGVTAYRVLIPYFGPEYKKGTANIQDLISKLDYLNNGKTDGKSLGIKILILHSPLKSVDEYGKHVKSYTSFKRNIGGNWWMKRLSLECKKRGIKLLVHYNTAYMSNLHKFFQDAYGYPGSKKKDWFFFADDLKTKYREYNNNPATPLINISDDPFAENYFLNNIWDWIKMGIDGFFFDSSDLHQDSWWHKVNASINKYRMNLLLCGAGEGKPGYIDHLYHGMFNIVDHVRFPGELMNAFSDNSDPAYFSDFCFDFEKNIPENAVYFRSTSIGPGLRPATKLNNRGRLVSSIAFTLLSGGIPVINWGDELSLKSTPVPNSDMPPQMPWSSLSFAKNNPQSIFSIVKKLIELRKQYPALRKDKHNGKPVLTWNSNNKKGWRAFIRHTDSNSFFVGVMIFDNKIKSVSPEFKIKNILKGTYKGRDMLHHDSKLVKAVVDDDELDDLDVKINKRNFLLYYFTR